MVNKITAVSLAIVMLISMSAFAAFDDVESGSEYSNAINNLVQYGVLSGKGNGLFDPNAGLTRAEMAKIATVVAGLDSVAASSRGTSLYSDMDGSFWASGYVNVSARNNLILGYPDGTFAPEKQLNFAEAVTIVLRLLGYSTDVLGNNWPSAYTAKASELSLTTGIYYDDYGFITRADIALIIDRALLTDMSKNDSQQAKKLIELMDYTITNECIILATSKENKTLLSDDVSTTLGTFTKTNNSVDEYVTRKVKLVLDKNSKIVNVMPISQNSRDIIIQSVVGVEMAYTENSQNSSMRFDNTSVVYYQGERKTFQDVRNLMETGMTMVVYYSSNGGYDYSVIKDFDMLGPIVIQTNFNGSETAVGNYELNTNGLRVIRDGYESALSDIQAFDVVYYNNVSNILYVYCDKVSGIYEKALPNKASVTRVVLSGVEYELETQNAATRLGEHAGAYKINDFVTLLLGKDGRVVSAVNTNATDLTTYGIILSSEERVSEELETKGTTEFFLTAFTISGIEQEFKTDKDYTQYRGRIIKYQFENGILKPQLITNRKISGSVDASSNSIGDYWLSKDAKIVDLIYAPAINEQGSAKAKLIELSDIPYATLDESSVVHAYVDTKFADIQFIVLNNVTLSRYDYGILTKKTSGGSNNSYVLDIKGSQRSFSSSKLFQPSEGQPIMASIQNNSLLELKPLYEVRTTGSLGAIDRQRIRIGNTSYSLSSDASAYLHKDFNFTSVSMNDISSYSMKSARIFADMEPSRGGLVRVIVFYE